MNNNLQELADNINIAFERSQQLYADGIDYLKLALLADKEIGDTLLSVKESLPHGDFALWIQANCQFGDRHARRLMTIARDWTKIMTAWENIKSDTRDRSAKSVRPGFQAQNFVRNDCHPLLSLRAAIVLATADPKLEAPPLPPITKYKVAAPNHVCFGEIVEVEEELNHGDVILCKTSKGKIPFLRKELVGENQPIVRVDAEIIDVEIDISEQLKEAIATILEYLPELQLKHLLAQALFVSKDYLPSDDQGGFAKLIGGQEVAVLESQKIADCRL